MKQKITISTLSLILLIAVMLVSLAANLIQYERATSDIPLPITGSYCTNAFSTNCTYLVFDKTESYTLYNQTDGVLEQGSYAEYIGNHYSLTGKCDSDRRWFILYSKGCQRHLFSAFFGHPHIHWQLGREC